MNQRGNARVGQMGSQFIPIGKHDRKDVVVAGAGLGLHRDRQALQFLAVNGRNFTTPAVPVIKFSQSNAQYSGMYFVETAVVSDHLAVIIFTLAVVPKQARSLRYRPIGGDDHAAITVRSKIFRRIKTEGRCKPKRSASAPARLTAVSLGRILQYRNANLRYFL